MNSIDRSFPIYKIMRPTHSVGKALLVLSALAIIAAVGAVSSHYTGVGHPIIFSASGAGLATLGLIVYEIYLIRVGFTLKRCKKVKRSDESWLDAACNLEGKKAMEAIKLFVRLGADVNGKGSIPPLVWMAHKKNLEAVKYLVKHGADVNIKSRGEMIALLEAANNNDFKMVKFLLECKAKPDQQNSAKKTALHYAVENQNEKMVKLLLIYRANPHLKDFKGQTPLHYAEKSDNKEMVELLIDMNKERAALIARADITVKDIEQKTPHDLAKSNENSNVTTSLYYPTEALNRKVVKPSIDMQEERTLLNRTEQSLQG